MLGLLLKLGFPEAMANKALVFLKWALVLVLLAALLTVILLYRAEKESSDNLKREVGALELQRDSLSSELSESESDKDEIRARYQDLLSSLKQREDSIKELNSRLSEAQGKIDNITQEDAKNESEKTAIQCLDVPVPSAVNELLGN